MSKNTKGMAFITRLCMDYFSREMESIKDIRTPDT
jgi:hypothetical protein